MDRPGGRYTAAGAALDTAANAPAEQREAIHVASRMNDYRSGLRELRARLRQVNAHITGAGFPDDPKTPAPDSTALAALLDDFDNLVAECNRLATAIEANLA